MSKETIKKEILELHRLFQDWYRNGDSKISIDDIAKRLSDNFCIIFPDASANSKKQILELLAKDRGNTPDFRIEVKDIKITELSHSIYLATYEEWQYWGAQAPPKLKLKSSSILKQEKYTIKWINIHETKIETRP
jgi:hypothetical protein